MAHPGTQRGPKAWGIAGLILAVFLSSSLGLWLLTQNPFYLFDLPFIGLSLALGILFGRRIAQLLVGAYFLFFLGLAVRVNMQIEGFLFQVLGGSFTAAFVHYAIAKIAGPAVFGRGFCAYGCWTAAVLDFLPWRRSPGRRKGWGLGRYLSLAAALILVGVLFFAFQRRQAPGDPSSVGWFLSGVLVYWGIGVGLAAALRDNRAFCKYLCPIAPMMKVAASVSRLRVRIDPVSCTGCRACEKACPMDVAVLRARGEGRSAPSTECILCGQCGAVCPEKALKISLR